MLRQSNDVTAATSDRNRAILNWRAHNQRPLGPIPKGPNRHDCGEASPFARAIGR
jgi:hypothetical protein